MRISAADCALSILRLDGKYNNICRVTLLVLSIIGGIVALYMGQGWGAALGIPLSGCFLTFGIPFIYLLLTFIGLPQVVTQKELYALKGCDGGAKIKEVIGNKHVDINTLVNEYPLLYYKMNNDPSLVICLLNDRRIDINQGRPGALKKALEKYYEGRDEYEITVQLFLKKEIDFEKNYGALALLLRFCHEKNAEFLKKCDTWSASLLMRAYNAFETHPDKIARRLIIEAFQKNEERKHLFYKNLLIFLVDCIQENDLDSFQHFINVIEYHESGEFYLCLLYLYINCPTDYLKSFISKLPAECFKKYTDSLKKLIQESIPFDSIALIKGLIEGDE